MDPPQPRRAAAPNDVITSRPSSVWEEYLQRGTESFAKVLSAGNPKLLRVIAEKTPGSLDGLARITGKAKSNLSLTLWAT
jgi:predicted transcriptional regulator